MEKVFVSHSEADTIALAEKLAEISEQGDIWALNGTLGAGKSVFARAFIQKLTGAKEVPSPTFTLLQTYSAEFRKTGISLNSNNHTGKQGSQPHNRQRIEPHVQKLTHK